MNLSSTPDPSPPTPSFEEGVARDVARACAKIAPTWPLDRFIAVNPFWPRVHTPVEDVGAELAALSGARLLMPRSWFREQRQLGTLREEHLLAARARGRASVDELLRVLARDEAPPPTRLRVMDVVDRTRDLAHAMSFREFVVQSTSQICAASFDEGQATIRSDRREGLYATFLAHAKVDRSPSIRMGHRRHRELAAALPTTARETLVRGLLDLGVAERDRESYLVSLLLDVNGWASYCAYLRWTAKLAGEEDDRIVELLAVRVAWEWMLLQAGGPVLREAWRKAMASWAHVDASARAYRRQDWAFLEAMELGWQSGVCARLREGFAATRPVAEAQVVFCIDVRSEVFRRALEAESSSVETLGFAGFFGLPIAYEPLGTAAARPQLPGLLAPRLRATDAGLPADLPARRSARLGLEADRRAFKRGPLASFPYVEAMGLVAGAALVADSLHLRGGARRDESAGLTAAEDALRKPRLAATSDGAPIGVAERCDLAAGILRAMSLTRGFAPVVVLVGHGSRSENNAHAAGLDCGACCGQTGEVNARAVAALLNEPAVREGLRERGIHVPDETRFVAGLHDTTTDDITLFDLDELPPTAVANVAVLRGLFAAAGVRARRERAPKLGLRGKSDAEIERALARRARDWAEVRPEWGLADNAAFLIAPRERSRHIDLGGRAFLHDYRHEEDEGGAILELLLTAPMVVTHWINFQYYASTVDNERYGSGNKVLHNVVGGHLGVFEGNGGDLRIGLPLQSLHDGTRWMHTPLRLAVFVEAPTEAIEGVLRKHERVRQLVDHGWIHLLQIDPGARLVRRREAGEWVPVRGGSRPPPRCAGR